MKCIRNMIDKKVSRVTDKVAALKVKSGTHSYVPKSVWKEVRNK